MTGRTGRTRYWNAPLPGVSCLHATFTSQHFAPHSHEALVIVVTEAGGSAYTSRRRSAEAVPSFLLVFNPAEPHAGHMRESRYWQYRALYLAQPALDHLLPSLGRTRVPGFTSNAFADPPLIRGFAAAHRELEAGDPALAREQLIDACGRLFSAYGADLYPETASRRERSQVDIAQRVIRERFRERLSIDDLATITGLSPFQLIRQFNRITGMPPHAHVLRARLHESIRQMRNGTPISDAAIAAGFYDQSALTRHFRRAYGITPGEYVRASLMAPSP